MNSSQPRISVLLSAHNAESTLVDALRSLSVQSFQDWEALVMDDGSTDRTNALLQDYATRDSRVKPLKHDQRVGLTGSLIELAHQARGEFLMRQDADDWSDPGRMQHQVAMFGDSELGVCGSWVVWHDENGQELGTSRSFTSSLLLKRQLRHRNPLVHGSLMMRKKCYAEVGGYRQAFDYAQDYDLLLRLCEKYDITVVPSPLYHLRLSSDGIGRRHIHEQQAFAAMSKACQRQRDHHLPDTAMLQNVAPPRNGSVARDPHLEQAIHLVSSGQGSLAREKLRLAPANHWRNTLQKQALYGFSFLPTALFRGAGLLKRLWELR